jgi:lysophospholipase L1-like esterase
MPIEPAKRRVRWRGWAPLFVTFGVLLLIELGLRVAKFEFNPYGHYDRASWGQFVEGRNRVDYAADPDVFFRFIPSRVIDSPFGAGAHINVHGFRGPEIPRAKDPARRRVVTLGDSGTFGWMVTDDECYPRQLESILREMYTKAPVDVINAGVPGYTSLQGLRYFKGTIAGFKPDLVIVAFGGNDADKLDFADKDRRSSTAGIAVQGFLLKSRLYQWLYKTLIARKFDLKTASATAETERVSLEDFATNLDDIVGEAEAIGANAILLARPGKRAEEYMNAMRAVAKHRGIPFIAEGIEGHPKGDVYAQIARRVARLIVEYELLTPPAPR